MTMSPEDYQKMVTDLLKITELTVELKTENKMLREQIAVYESLLKVKVEDTP